MATTELIRQHLIDPEICIRCNTCEETCPRDAITHDANNYVVTPGMCENCSDCIAPCPTGAIDSWRRVATPFTVEEQFGWDALPVEEVPGDEAVHEADIPEEVARLSALAIQGQGGQAPPPWSAAHPYVGLYTLAKPATATCSGNLRLSASDRKSTV